MEGNIFGNIQKCHDVIVLVELLFFCLYAVRIWGRKILCECEDN